MATDDVTDHKQDWADYPRGIVLINKHEPEGETTGRLLELAEEKGYSPRSVEVQRGEHDTPLSWRVPQEVADAFNGEREGLWPDDEVTARRKLAEQTTGVVETDEARGTTRGTKIENNEKTSPTGNKPSGKAAR